MSYRGLFTNFFSLAVIVVSLALGASLPAAFGFERETVLGATLLTLSGLFFFLVCPLLLIRFLYQEPLASFSWRFPQNLARACGYSAVAFFALLIPVSYLSTLPEFKDFYRFDTDAFGGSFLLLFFLTALYFFAEEFLFRGFFFEALRRRYGTVAVLLDATVFALLHFGKPALEVGFAFFAAATLSWLTLMTRSFLPAAFVHWLLAIVLTLAVSLT